MICVGTSIFIGIRIRFSLFLTVESPFCDSEAFTCLFTRRSWFNGFIDQQYSIFAIWGADHSSSESPQIAFAFFDSTSKAAASARAFSLRCNSFSSFLRSFSESLSSRLSLERCHHWHSCRHLSRFWSARYKALFYGHTRQVRKCQIKQCIEK